MVGLATFQSAYLDSFAARTRRWGVVSMARATEAMVIGPSPAPGEALLELLLWHVRDGRPAGALVPG